MTATSRRRRNHRGGDERPAPGRADHGPVSAAAEPRRDALEHPRDIGGGLPAVVRVAAQADLDQRAKFSGRAWRRLVRRGLLRQDRADQPRLCRRLERPSAAEHLVQNGTERVDIRPHVGVAPVEPLWRQVMEGPWDDPLRGDADRLGGELRESRARRAPHRGQAEVQQLGAARPGDEDVGGLQIAVNNAAPVGEVQRLGDLDHEPKQFAQAKWPLAQSRRERLTFEVLHHQVRAAFLEARVVERADVRMVQRRDGFRLAGEAYAGLLHVLSPRRDHLDCDEAVEARVLGLEHFTHAARAERLDDDVRSEPGTLLQRHHESPCALTAARDCCAGDAGSWH